MKSFLIFGLVLSCCWMLIGCAAFTQGNIVVSQRAFGDASHLAKAVNLIEYTPTGTYVQTIAMPTDTQLGYRCVTAGYSVEGRLSISPNRKDIGIGCFDDAVGASSPSAKPPPNPQRVSFFVDSSGYVVNIYPWSGEFPTHNLSSVRTTSRVWASGYTYVMTVQSSGDNPYKLFTISSFARTLRIFGERLYMIDNTQLFQIGTDLTASGATTTLISNAGTFLHDYVMLDVSTTVKGYDTVYFVDNENNAKKLSKWTFDGTTWTLQGSVTLSDSVTAITGLVDTNGDAILYVTLTSAIVKFNDLTMVGTIVNGGEFGGISMAPTGLCSDGSKTLSIGESDVDCGGTVCEKCANGKTCTSSLDCLENTCINNICVTACADGIKNFGETDVDCGGANCRASYKCAVGKQCSTGSDCASSSCSNGVCVAATCSDGIKNQDETDVDCGGSICSVCNDGKGCTTNSDCKSLQCTSNKCVATTCSNNVKDNGETDVDCGGSCRKCALNKVCSIDADCVINNCIGSLCVTPTCSDSKKNQDEGDVDCGGASCAKCGTSKSCNLNSDCTSLNCVNSKCAAPSCSDGILNQDETDIDCGGSCPGCAATKICNLNTDCLSINCVNSKCATATCADSVKNQDESDVDCGGNTCNKCANTKVCSVNSDCTSLHCQNNFCVAASCTDGVKNPGETDVDCGGANCGKCADNKDCSTNTDCLSSRCVNSKCATATCSDSVINQDETDIDCGGSVCAKCAASKRCGTSEDCVSLNCKNTVCLAATCSDNILNQDETDTDCGGVCSVKCSASKICKVNADCKSNVCTNSICQASCSDGEKNQDETDVDCGGVSCNKCAAGKTCTASNDCTTGVCSNSVCTQSCSDSGKNNGETDVDCGGPLCASCGVGKTCSKNSDCDSNFCDNAVCATPVVPVAAFECNCNTPTPYCDKAFESCVGLRVVPIVQCVQQTVDNEYMAYMAYDNKAGSEVTLPDAINFVNIATVSPPSVFSAGRPHIYPRSAFTISSTEAESVTWYADGYNLTFKLDNQQLVCPEDLSFVMTSSATVEQLTAISGNIVGNLSDVMGISSSRLQVTFSTLTKRQTTSTINVLVTAGEGPSSYTVVLAFLERDLDVFQTLVSEAAVASVSAVPLENEVSAESPISPSSPTPTSTPIARPTVSGSIMPVMALSILLGVLTLLLF